LTRAERAANQVLRIKKSYNISVVLVGPTAMAKLNRRYRGKNKSTDVLSFSNINKDRFILPKGERIEAGDIFICPAVAKKQAKQEGHSFSREMQRLYVHGLLHLLGYRHGRAADRKKMLGLQANILKKMK
ncbi:rRNA maturation RNase YbeY, partial [Candidatus Saccharibacteria bacterium]|nr:rRNA maturation RNase YbeY [Candidatus Saccharibacteria bacterium]NIV04215.1 rRNA maturation RNase YbeY [Calditrichia bacterium]NIS38736.1 rRNA maturation RNase YbeY [Candidatus Saccharibacteria bacterium]NIV72663.1 rRNA maturation RNase YbeY [Calditrichia bacterium]NIV99815.1 rRNA maturation RNase YbeY [Candidatus Saccharibacteria bacterium]